MSERVFRDRRDAGRTLARLLENYSGRDDVVVLGLPRGGVPVAYEVAAALNAPLDVFLVRKLGVPGHEEVAMGAIASGGVVVLNEDIVIGSGISSEVVRQVAERESRELMRRERVYREGRPMPELSGRVVIVVDDGLATGSSMRAAILALRRLEPARIVVAVPAAPSSTCEELRLQVTVRRWSGCPVKRAWRSCRAQHICSKSRAHWTRSRAWPETGSSSTCGPRRSASVGMPTDLRQAGPVAGFGHTHEAASPRTAQEIAMSAWRGCERVVIVGAGFAGFHAARTLARLAGRAAEVILVNPTDYLLYLPLLPEVTAGFWSHAGWQPR